MAVPSIEFLSRCFEQEGSDEDDHFPWNKLTCLAVVCYAIKKNHESSLIIRSLDNMAKHYLNVEIGHSKFPRQKQKFVGLLKKFHQFIFQWFVDSFIPEVQIHFTVPELDHLSDKDKNLKRNEILASFIDFLVQILHREANVDTARKQRYVPLQKALSFILAVLGDKPFDGVLEEQVKDMLVEFEALANEAGHFIYSCVFSLRPVEDETFYAKRNALVEKFAILNANIKQHCIKFSELPIHDVPQSKVMDSLFIIHSLVDDLEKFSPDFFLMKDQIAMLHDESKALLKFVEARQDAGTMKEPLVQILDLAYEAEYLISSHVVGNIHAWYLDLRLPSITQKIKLAREWLQQIKEVQPLQQIKEVQPSQVMIRYGREISDVTHAAAMDDKHLVESQHNKTDRILTDLVDNPKSPRQTIYICGMPGIGKTTIASNLYNCSSASRYFDRRAWCVVSHAYSLRSLLINILIHVERGLKKDEIFKKSDPDLSLCIHKSLVSRRYLIVLDDVWDPNAWNDLKRRLPDDGNGSRVILTSRIKNAAPDGCIYHTLPPFSKDECWELLEKKTFPGESCPPELLNIGKGIAAKCSGIPLAVIVTAGILANLKREEVAWERVEKQFDVYLLDGDDYRKILELSYEHLPHNMKPCFLYFAAFPEDAKISVNKLAWRWIAEGFIWRNEGKSQEQIAEMYLLELTNRSLVIPGKIGSDGRIKTCRIHDLLRDICVMIANKENFLSSNNELSIYEKHQRPCLFPMSNADLRPFGLHCRSLIGGFPDRSSCFQTRALLKVLDIFPHKFQKFDGTSLDLPIQLRYLGVNHLTNSMVAKLVHLEFINVVNHSKIKVPSIILRMKKLRHLLVKNEAIFEDDSYISEMTNLKTLSYVRIYEWADVTMLRYSVHLQKLKCKCGGEIIFPDLSFLKELETLKMVFEDSSISHSKEVSNLNFPSTIKNLCLSNALLPWNKMSIIGRLPSLCVLKLELYAFVGDEWETLDGGFEELRVLKIDQHNLKHWTTCSEHFPKLELLVLHSLRILVEIPCDLGHIQTLRRIDVTDCSIRASLSAVQIEENQREEYGNKEIRVNVTTSYWTKEELVVLYRKKMEHALVVECDGKDMYELSSIICSPERDFVVREDGEQIKVNSLKGKIVGIYFSAFHSESCQLFTRKLVRVYNELKKYGHFEIVYVSSDKDVDEVLFNANFSKFPWLAIPLTDSDTRYKLDELFHVQGIPHLVILDENGEVLTEEGVRIVEEDGGDGYPFFPQRIAKIKQLEYHKNEHIKQVEEEEDEAKRTYSLESLLVSKTRDYVIDNNRDTTLVSKLVGKTIMLFFGGSRGPECRTFVPKLVQVYQEINEKYNNYVEVIFISCDEDQFVFDEFFASMPWLALSFFDDRKESLCHRYKLKSIPMLVVIGPTGKTITTEGVNLVKCHGAEAYPFTSKRLKEIESENDKMAEQWPKKVRKEVHEHELGLFNHKAYYNCDGCVELGCNWAYRCGDCNFDLHPKCALGDDYKTKTAESWPKEVMKEVHVLEEPKEEATRNDSLESLLVSESRDYVIDNDEKKIPLSNLVGKTTMLFFAAHWCPPCRFVLAELAQRYQENNEKHNNSVEVIFVSSDKDQSSFDKFFAMMQWLALPFGDDRIKSLRRLFNVRAIPMLITIEPTGKTVADKAWELISYPGAEAYPFTYEWVQSQARAQQMVIFWPKKVKNKLHEHALCFVKQILYDCYGCDEVGFDGSYNCEDCGFSLHPNCALGDDKTEVKGELENEEKKTGTSEGMGT